MEQCCFSPLGDLVAIGGLDGELRVWDTSSAALRQRLTVSAPGEIRALSWSRPARHKRKAKPMLLAVAVETRLDVWNFDSGDKVSTLLGHSDTVTSASWGKSCLFSGSHDCHVIQWAKDGSVAHKWKADRHYITSVCCHDDQRLLTAGRSIKLWSLEDYSLLKKFTGHGSDVRWMGVASDGHFLSTASSDRTINVWSSTDDVRTALFTLSCDEEIMSCDVKSVDPVMQVAAVSVVGSCHLFRVDLTNQITEPVSAFSTVQISSSDATNPTPLPVLAAHMTDHVTLAHTSSQRPQFESIDFQQSDRRVCLIRESGGLLLSQHSEVGKSPQDHVTILGPGNMTVDNQRSKGKSTNLPLMERLDSEKTVGSGAPSAESLSQLLSQAAASGDDKLFEEVLRISKERIIRATIRRLPVTMVTPLLNKLVELIQSQPGRGLELSFWLRALVTTHSSYLMTVPSLSGPLSSLYQLLESRVGCYEKLARLQGKLDLCLSTRPSAQGDAPVNTPLITVTAGDDSVGSMVQGNSLVRPHISGDDWSSDESSDQSDDSMDTNSGAN